MNKLTRLILTLPRGYTTSQVDRLLAMLALHVAHGWEEHSLSTGEMRCIVYGAPEFCEELFQHLTEALPEMTIESDEVQEQNWAEAWKEFFTPVEGGEHFLVIAPWMEKEKKATRRIPIIIEPKTAFGTGHHATTALCLNAISELYGRGKITPATRFLDLGTGSGILGIACCKLGLKGEGLDIDIAAVENALENRSVNTIEEHSFSVMRGGIEEASGTYDLILANILANPLKSMAGQIKAMLSNGGILVLSGLLAIQAKDVASCYTALGLEKPQKFIQDEWAALVFGV